MVELKKYDGGTVDFENCNLRIKTYKKKIINDYLSRANIAENSGSAAKIGETAGILLWLNGEEITLEKLSLIAKGAKFDPIVRIANEWIEGDLYIPRTPEYHNLRVGEFNMLFDPSVKEEEKI